MAFFKHFTNLRNFQAQHEGIDHFSRGFYPEKFKMPDIDKYDGTGCSKTHLQLFFLKSRFYGAHSEADGLYLTSSQLPLP